MRGLAADRMVKSTSFFVFLADIVLYTVDIMVNPSFSIDLLCF